MKLTTAILVLMMAAATAWGQNPDVIQNTRDTMRNLQQKKAMDSNAALEAGGVTRSERRDPAKPETARRSREVEHVSVADSKPPAPAAKKDHREPISVNGRRDPFISPVVMETAVGSGCSTGKKCLNIGQIVLKGIVKSDNGMIAVVVNALDKAYFLHENDPVFNGYVLRITGDSVVFKETFQDRLGKTATREVTKRIVTPAV